MSFSIQTNVNSLIAQENLRVNSNFQNQTIQRLTSGYRINSSGDDAAGLAIANKFRSDTTELAQGVRNANDGISTLQIIDGGMNNVSKMLDRLRTLATQSASQTFTGDRNVLNSEFQSLLSEIDRQATSIGLGQGGQFAKALGVYIGGGKTTGGDLDIGNGTVTLDLTASTVDAKSLGLKGFQVTAGSVDIGDGAADTTVAKIVANTSNGTSGTTSLYFAGPGFSDHSKVQVSVNLSSVTNIDTLVTAVNAAIQNAGNGTSQAATAFKSAAISASVHTNTDGTKQMAFTSSSTAFQVEAGDKMANALMGNFSDASTATGNSITTTLNASQAYDATSGDAIGATTVRLTGAGLDAPVDFTLSSTTVGAAVTELINQVNSNGVLQSAGISVSDNASTLQFTNTRGESFSVEATGDVNNRLGLGSFLKDSLGAVDYTTYTAGAYSETSTATHGTAKLEISLNGAASETPIAIDLFGGNATAGKVTGGQVTDGIVIDDANKTVALKLDGVASNVTLDKSTAATEAVKAGTVVTGDNNIEIAAAKGGSLSTSGVDYSVAANCDFSADGLDAMTFTVSVDGDTPQTVTLNQDYGGIAGVAGAIADQLSGVNVAITDTNIIITSKTTGTAGSVQMGGANRADVGFADAVEHTGSAGNNVISYSVDGGAETSVTLEAGTYTGATLLAEIQGKLGDGVEAGFVGDTGFTGAQYDALDAGVLTFKSAGGTGADKSIVFNNVANNANTVLGLDAPTTAAHGTDAETFTLADIAGQIQDAIGGAGTATAADGRLIIETTTKGTAGSVQITANNADLGLASAAAVSGDNRTVSNIVDALNQTFTSNANMQDAGLKASVSVGKVKIESTNNTYFRLSAAGSDATADIGFGVAGASFAAAKPVSGGLFDRHRAERRGNVLHQERWGRRGHFLLRAQIRKRRSGAHGIGQRRHRRDEVEDHHAQQRWGRHAQRPQHR